MLFARIQKRALPMELQISDAYLRALCDAYNDFFYHYDATPLLTVNAEHLNPLDSHADLALLVDRIEIDARAQGILCQRHVALSVVEL